MGKLEVTQLTTRQDFDFETQNQVCNQTKWGIIL